MQLQCARCFIYKKLSKKSEPTIFSPISSVFWNFLIIFQVNTDKFMQNHMHTRFVGTIKILSCAAAMRTYEYNEARRQIAPYSQLLLQDFIEMIKLFNLTWIFWSNKTVFGLLRKFLTMDTGQCPMDRLCWNLTFFYKNVSVRNLVFQKIQKHLL